MEAPVDIGQQEFFPSENKLRLTKLDSKDILLPFFSFTAEAKVRTGNILTRFSPFFVNQVQKSVQKRFLFFSFSSLYTGILTQRRFLRRRKKGGDFFAVLEVTLAWFQNRFKVPFPLFFLQVSLLFPSFFTAVCKGAFTKVEFVVSQCHFKVTFFLLSEPKFL